MNLQIQRTTLPDEMVFYMYHQVNELIFKMILWEMRQISIVKIFKLIFLQKINANQSLF
jgi:tryptophan 2,3-dioxygenase